MTIDLSEYEDAYYPSGRKKRPGWDATFLNQADVAALRSLCEGTQVGAVLVDVDNLIIGTGYNGPPRSFDTGGMPCTQWCLRQQTSERTEDYSNCPSLHAEMNCILNSERERRQGATLYVTRAPCAHCAKMITGSGIMRVIWRAASASDERIYQQQLVTKIIFQKAKLEYRAYVTDNMYEV